MLVYNGLPFFHNHNFIGLKQQKIFLVPGFHLRFYRHIVPIQDGRKEIRNVDPNLHAVLLHKVLPQTMILQQPEQKIMMDTITKEEMRIPTSIEHSASLTAVTKNGEPGVQPVSQGAATKVTQDDDSEAASPIAEAKNREPGVQPPPAASVSLPHFKYGVCEGLNQFKNYEMKSKWENFQRLLWHVHGAKKVVEAKKGLYGCHGVVNYERIKKYMVMYQDILVWYMENVEHPPVPENMEKGLCFYTKRDDGSLHSLQDYIAVVIQFLDDLIAKSALRFLGRTQKKRGFHCTGTMPSTSQVLLPIFLPLVVHFVLHYSDVITNLYHIHFDFDGNIVSLSPSEISEGHICLSPLTVTEGIIYLVIEWLIRKMIDQEEPLFTGEITPFDRACNEYISQVLCAFMLAENIAVTDLFDNSCKVLLENI
eukprot:jgi/Psemu1/12578/gm1.12578_g